MNAGLELPGTAGTSSPIGLKFGERPVAVGIALVLLFIVASYYATCHSLRLQYIVQIAAGPSFQKRLRDHTVRDEEFLVAFGNGRFVKCELQTTSKGNGGIYFGKSHIRHYDCHDDCTIYESGFLSLRLRDLNGDGVREVILSGCLTFTGEKEYDPRVSTHFELILRLNDSNELELIEFDVEDPALAAQTIEHVTGIVVPELKSE